MSMANKKVVLRAIEPHHIDLLYNWENDMQMWRVSNLRVPLSKYALSKYVESSHRDIWESREQRLLIESIGSNKPVGTIELFDFDPYHSRAGIGLMVFSPHDRKKGYATAAISLMLEYAKNELGIRQLYANIAADNRASISLFTKLGFVQCGLKKQWLKISEGWTDELMFQLFL